MSALFRFAACLWLLAFTSMVTAQPETEQSAEDPKIVAARQNFRSGKTKLASGDYEEALIDFRLADAVVKVPTTRLWVAKTLKEMGRLVEARTQARSVEYLPAPPDEYVTLVEARVEAAALAKELDSKIARINLVVVPTNTEVLVDHELLTAAQHTHVDVDPGKHTVRGTATGHLPSEQTFEVKEGELRTVEVRLEPLAGTSPVPMPTPRVIPATPDTTPSGPILGPVAWTGIGIAGAGIIVGAVAGGITLSRASEVDELCTAGDGDDCLEPDHDELAAAQISAHVSTAGFVATSFGVVLGLVGMFALDEPIESAGTVTPLLGPAYIGIRGSF